MKKEWSEPETWEAREAWVDDVANGDTDDSFAKWLETYEPEVDADFEWVIPEDYSPNETPISYASAVVLAKVIAKKDSSISEDRIESDAIDIVIQHNDAQTCSPAQTANTRTKVLDAFAEAIRSLGGEPLVDHVAAGAKAKALAKRRKAAAEKRKAADLAARRGN